MTESAAGVVRIPLAEIRFDQSAQAALDTTEIEAMAQTIATHGLPQPIVVRPLTKAERGRSKRRYQLLVGSARLHAATKAGLREVDALVSGSAPTDALLTRLADAGRQRVLARAEEDEQLRYLRDELHLRLEDIAAVIGKSVPYVSRRLTVSANPQIAAAVREGRIPPSVAQEIVATPPDWWPILIEHASGMTRDALRAAITEAHRAGLGPDGLRRLLEELAQVSSGEGLSPAFALLRAVRAWAASVPEGWQPNAEERAMVDRALALVSEATSGHQLRSEAS